MHNSIYSELLVSILTEVIEVTWAVGGLELAKRAQGKLGWAGDMKFEFSECFTLYSWLLC